MSKNLLDQLADTEIPSLPTNLNRQVHRRLNIRLMLGQFFDLMVRGLPYTFFHLTQVLLGLVSFTLTGRHFNDSNSQSDSDENSSR